MAAATHMDPVIVIGSYAPHVGSFTKYKEVGSKEKKIQVKSVGPCQKSQSKTLQTCISGEGKAIEEWTLHLSMRPREDSFTSIHK